jgi:hypothetical protein
MSLPFSPRRLVIAQHKIDYRKQWNGLLAEAYRMGFDPYQGDCVVFLKRDRTQLRVLCGDRLGLFLLSRRFDGGRLAAAWDFLDAPQAATITQRELKRLFDGVSVVVRRVKPTKLGLQTSASPV